MEQERDYLRYHSFLNAISKEFEEDLNRMDVRTQKKLLALTVRIIDAFSDIYGDHDLKKASNEVSIRLAARKLHSN